MSGATVLRLDAGLRLCVPPGGVARVISGAVNAAAVPFHDDVPDGPGLHVSALETGELAIGTPHAGLRIELSVLAHATLEIAARPTGDDIPALDHWFRTVERIGAWVPLSAPRALFPGRAALQSGEVVAAPRDAVVWTGTAGDWMILTDTNPRTWPLGGDVEIVTTGELFSNGSPERAISGWNDATSLRLATMAANEPARRVANIAAATNAVANAAAAAHASISSMLELAPAPVENRDTDALARVVALSAADPDGSDPMEAVRRAADQAGFGTRMVTINQRLDGEDGPKLLVALEDDGAPTRIAAAWPGALGYAISGRALSPAVRPGLATRALALTEPLSDRLIAALHKPAAMMTALAAASPADTVVALFWGLAGIATAIALPAAVNLLFTSVWPRADVSGHWLVIVGLAMIALAGVAFDAARSLRAARLSLRFASMLENGVWLRLARARRVDTTSGAGDTQERFAEASHLRVLLGNQPMRFMTDLGMLATGLAQMVYYGGQLAWIGIAAVVLITVCCVSLMPPATRARTQTAELTGRQTALLAQSIAAITKVKATASENFILARWAAVADRRRTALRRAERMETASGLAVAGISGFATAAVFALAGLASGGAGVDAVLSPGSPAASASDVAPWITLGPFLAFQVSLGQAMAAATSAAGMTALWPALAAAGARLHPIATLPPETTGHRTAPPPLDGAITVSHVTHHYPGSDAPSLDDVDLTIAPRDYVAIVGASGSGKSTLLRILLGLEQPDRGAVYFDGLDGRQLDPALLRRQIGYVGQDSRLAPGSILDNILDGRHAGAPAAWDAARLAGLAEDIEAMPMGMQTLVGEGGQNISGGQRQRILIARAVLSRPRILIFDEATSALDNRTQAIVQRGLAELPVTRIVVAHRLSTIREVDRVFVLSKGRLVESGSPGELSRQGGVFSALAGRQILSGARAGDG